EVLTADAERTDGSIVLVVDQFEELLTLCGDDAERAQVAALLAHAARPPLGRLRVIVTLRDDFLVRAEHKLPPLRDLLSVGLRILTTPARDDLIRIVTEPARKAGYTFEDAGMVDEMVGTVADQPGALALLSFTASRLWELRDRKFRQLGRKAYAAVGGV